MRGECAEFSLEEVCLGVFDCPHSTPKLSDSGPYMVRTQDIRGGYFDTSSAVHVGEEVYLERTQKAEPAYGDLLFSREGTYFGDAAEVPKATRVCLGQRMVLIRPNPDLIRAGYLRIQINSPLFQAMIMQYRDGTVAERLNLPVIRNLVVKLPPIKVQDYIIENVTCLEKKIEINRQMNTTLESMAQAMFKSWFVDFDPVIDNALAAGNSIPETLHARAETRKALGDKRKPLPEAIQKQFPYRFVFSEEMGWIPDGWSLGKLSDIAELKTESVNPNKEPDKHWAHYSIPAFDDGKCPTLDLGETIKSGKYCVPATCILASKLNPQFPRIWMPDVEDEGIAICSTEFMPFVPRNDNERGFLYAFLCSDVIQTEIANRVTGSTGSRQRVKPKEIAELPILVVPQKTRGLLF